MNKTLSLEKVRVNISMRQEDVKRDYLLTVFNYSLALVLIVMLMPLMLFISMLILIFDRQPILYYGKRMGKNGRVFTMYKFRTLQIGTEEKVGKNLMKDDQGFITPIGHYLRCLKLDELPQLFNIIKGDMNFVGPRPVRKLMADDYVGKVKGYSSRFAVKPGLTGLAQLRGGYYCNPARKTKYDLFYINKRSMLLDLKLMGLTALRMVVSPGCLKSGDRPIGKVNFEHAQGEVAGSGKKDRKCDIAC